MTDSTTVSTWIDGYRRAWDSNEPDDIRALFTQDGEYRTAPFVDPRVGQDAIVAGWIKDQDQPGDYDFTWKLAGLAGDTAFVEGDTRYADGRRYANLWVIAFAPDGRASSFTEWYMRHPDEAAPHPNQ
ncbi:MAG TPA: nuclear transport factor 2 family protein [Pseudolysinimonas sp.]